MTVKIFIKRNVTGSFEDGLTRLLHQMRGACLMQEGYVSGQTLKRLDVPGERLVISTWRSLEDWESWYNSAERRDIQIQIDSLLGEDTVYEVYH
jgi:heme-degrading monooxygenase HmoA